MNNKLWLTSMVAIGLALPASAATFPTNGYMKPTNGQATTYTGAAISTNMGVTSGTANADAYYNILAGYYLPANSYEAAQCTAGNYCAGIENIKSTSSAQGLTACSTVSGGYSSSAVGAKSGDDCYKSCSTIANATSTTGNLYSDGSSTCAPTACATGYTTEGFVIKGSTLGAGTGSYSTTNTRRMAKGLASGYDLTEGAVNTEVGSDFDYGLSAGQWAIDLNNHGGFSGGSVLYGEAYCSSQQSGGTGDFATNAQVKASTGNNCYCRFSGMKYIIPGPGAQSPVAGASLSDFVTAESKWTYHSAFASATDCTHDCTAECVNSVFGVGQILGSSHTMFRESILGSAASSSMCAPKSYVVTYACGTANGNTVQGVAPSASVRARYANSYTLASTAGSCLKLGYKANKWSTPNAAGTGTDEYAMGATISSWAYDAGKTFTMTWTPKTTTVSFNANSATSTTGSQTANVTATYDANMPTISTTKPVRTGYTFQGWYDNATYSSGTQYYTAAGASARTWNKDVSTSTLYAGWKANTITVEYACGTGATGNAPAQTTATYDANFTPSANNASSPCVKTGYEFAGWNDGTTTHQPGVAFKWTKTSTTTLTAVWTGKQITIKWYGVSDTGNTNGVFETTVTYGGDITTPTTPKMSASGQTFRGWVFRK